MISDRQRAYGANYYRENKEHIAQRHAEYYQENKIRINARNREHVKNNMDQYRAYQSKYKERNRPALAIKREELRQRFRNQFYDMYGLKKEGHEHGVCTCCKEADLVMFGTISHINGDGAQHRRAVNRNCDKVLMEAIAAHNPSRFAAECFNCNMGARRNGGVCPHKGQEVRHG